MSKAKREPMPVSERAKQFMPFAAVQGLEEALERKRREMLLVERAGLSQEMEETINEAMKQLKKGMNASVSYYCCGEYRLLRGTVEKVDPVEQCIIISGETIAFDDIRDIQ